MPANVAQSGIVYLVYGEPQTTSDGSSSYMIPLFFIYIHCFPFLTNRKVTLVMVGLDNAGKTATVRGIQGG